MTWLRVLASRFMALFHKGCLEQELDEELRAHHEMLVQENLQRGMAPEDARCAALRSFGGVEQVKEVYRERRGLPMIETLFQDVRYGIRMLAKNPGFTAVAVATLALGIGANAAIFSVVNAVLVRPLPYPEADHLVHAHWLFKSGDVPSVTGEEFDFWKDHSRVFESAAAHDLLFSGFNLLAGDQAEYVKGWRVSRDFFKVLGIEPVLGRGFTAEEDRPQGPGAVVLSHGLWQRRFGSDPGIVGRAVTLNNETYTVVGVMPEKFQFVMPYLGVQNVELWLPLHLVADPNDQGHDYLMLARLKPSVTLAQAQSDMARVLAEIRREVPGHVGAGERGALLVPYQQSVTNDVRAPLLILFAAVGLVLLIAAVNVANLVLARATGRSSEVAVRLALGASGGRVFRQFLTESLLIAFAGGAVGLAVAPLSVRVLLAPSPESLPLLGNAGLDSQVLAFTFLLATAAGVAAGLLPALRASRLNLSQAMREGSRSLSLPAGHRRLRRALVMGEVALSVLLLTGALLLASSLIHLERVNPGFNPQDVWAFHLALPRQKFKTAASAWTFEQEVLANLAALPGAESAGVVSNLPLEFGLNGGIRVKTGVREAHVYVQYRAASPDYFRTMEIPLVRGRPFVGSDRASSTLVVLVNRAFMHACCPSDDAIGAQVFLNIGSKGDVGREIVGIVGDTKGKDEGIAGPAPPTVFIPEAQLEDDLFRFIHAGTLAAWVVRSQAPLALSDVRGAVAGVDPSEAVADFGPMSRLVNEAIAPSRFIATLTLVFAGVALALAAVGLYGVMAYSVSERTHEIGLRMAFGADRANVLLMIVRQGLAVAMAGIGVGALLALAFTRFLRDLLFGVGPTDPLTFVLVVVMLAAVALLASYIPAQRATKVDPMVALRHE